MGYYVTIVDNMIERHNNRGSVEREELEYSHVFSVNEEVIGTVTSDFKWSDDFYKDMVRLSNAGFGGYIILRGEDGGLFQIKLDGEGGIREYTGEIVFEEEAYKELEVSDILIEEL